MSTIRFIRRRTALALASGLLIAASVAVGCPAVASAADYVPGEVVVGYAPGANASVSADIATRMGARTTPAGAPDPSTQVLALPHGLSVTRALAALRHRPGIAYAVPNFIAHIAASRNSGWIPNDPGRSHVPGGWEALQWNFLADAGVDAPQAWRNLIADKRPGARGVVVAVLDTGIAYRNWRSYGKSPDFTGTRFIDPYDFVAHNRYPLDRQGHGTFVTGTIAEATNNGVSLTGLAYGATIMPVRVLDADGSGDAATIARGIRYATTHGARVINLSLEFPPNISVSDIPDVLSAIRFAHRRGVVLVAAAGNEGTDQLAYPARASHVISVGASTRDRCLASYSNRSVALDLVAPGGGDDAALTADPNCHPSRGLPTIYQTTIVDSAHPRGFGLPGGEDGTSFAAPHVAAIAALIIASGVLGRRPTPDRILTRMESTARPLGGSRPNQTYGYGLVDAGAATARASGAAGHH
ncbi:MAG: S8 family serine peptidase [Solirubrobacteraceae bacterium]